MTLCIECSEEFSNKRAELGYKRCLECGSKMAHEEAKAKAKRVGLNYNKGQYQYITDGANLSELGKK